MVGSNVDSETNMSSFTMELNEYYSRVGREIGAKSFWSDFRVRNMDEDHPFPQFDTLSYSLHWGKETVTAPIPGRTWKDLYRAADQVIALSGDCHHLFIEDFVIRGNTLELFTGS